MAEVKKSINLGKVLIFGKMFFGKSFSVHCYFSLTAPQFRQKFLGSLLLFVNSSTKCDILRQGKNSRSRHHFMLHLTC